MKIVKETRPITDKQVRALLDMFFYRNDDIQRAISDAAASPWTPIQVGTRATVMCVDYVARYRYRVSFGI